MTGVGVYGRESWGRESYVFGKQKWKPTAWSLESMMRKEQWSSFWNVEMLLWNFLKKSFFCARSFVLFTLFMSFFFFVFFFLFVLLLLLSAVSRNWFLLLRVRCRMLVISQSEKCSYLVRMPASVRLVLRMAMIFFFFLLTLLLLLLLLLPLLLLLRKASWCYLQMMRWRCWSILCRIGSGLCQLFCLWMKQISSAACELWQFLPLYPS